MTVKGFGSLVSGLLKLLDTIQLYFKDLVQRQHQKSHLQMILHLVASFQISFKIGK